MSIHPDNADRYPPDWPAISYQKRKAAGWRCEWCGVKHGTLGGRADGVFYPALPKGEKRLELEWPRRGDWSRCRGYPLPLRIIRIVLTVAHIDHQPENCDPDNLVALCQQCHLRHDTTHHQQERYMRRKRSAGNLELFPEGST